MIPNVRMRDHNTSIIIFDSDCILCSHWIKFILRYEAKAHFHFASSRKPTGQKLAIDVGISPDALDLTYVVIDGGQAYTKSDASLVILRQLRAPWSWLRAFVWVPRPIRDTLYDIVARNRLRWFGTDKDCLLPPPEHRHRFLD